MEIYSSEEQQVDAIKRFLKDYGVVIVIGAVVGLGALYAWSHYSNSKIDNAELASEAYESLISQPESVAALSGDITKYDKEHSQKGYQAMLELMLAKNAAEAKDYPKAEQALNRVITANADEEMTILATMRLARVQAAQGQFDKAIATLDSVTAKAFLAKKDELKGDFLVRLGKDDEAKDAYQSAMDLGGLQTSPELQMKLENLNKA